MTTAERPLFGFLRPLPPGPRQRAEMRCRMLEVMAASVRRDVPLGPVVGAAAAECRGFERRALRHVHDRLESGAPLAVALESSGLLPFPAHTVAAVRAAEGTPRLASVLAAAADDDAQVENRRASVWAAAFYPLVVLAFVGGVAGGLISPTRQRLVEVLDCMEIGRSPALEFAASVGSVSGWIAIVAACLLGGAWLARRVPSLMGGPARLAGALWQTMPIVRSASRLGAGARLLNALAPCVRAGLPLDEALSRAAPATGCRASAKAALAASELASSGAAIDEVTNALLLPPAVRARLALAATRAPDAFADALGPLAGDCARRYQDALDRRMRWFQPAATLFAGAIVMAQLFGIFSMLALVRSYVPTW